MTPILFEMLNFSAIYVAIQAVLSLCGSSHRDETCLLFRLKRFVPLATSAVPVVTATLTAPAMYAAQALVVEYIAPALGVSYAATASIVEYVSPASAGSYVAPAPVVDTTRQLQWCLLLHRRLSSNMSRLLPQCTRRQRLWWSASRSLQPCTRHQRLWWKYIAPAPAVNAAQAHRARSSRVRGTSASDGVHRARSCRVRGTSACGGVRRARSSRVRGTSASGGVHRARSGRVRGTSATLSQHRDLARGVQKSPTMYVAIQTLLSLYGLRERSAVCTRVDAVSVMSFSGPSFFGGGVATTSGQQKHLPCRCTV